MYLYLSAIIILILVYFIKIEHKFWDKQPVMRAKNSNIEVIGLIPNFKIKLNGHNLRIVENNKNLDSVYSFLNDNFNNDYTLNYNYFKYCYNKPYSKNVTCFDKENNIIGYIHSEPIKIVFNKKLLNINYVDYLCVEKSNRSKNLASILISSLLNEYKNKQSIFLFKKDTSGLPYSSLIKTHYFYKDLREIVPIKIENVYKLSEYPKNATRIYEYYKKLVRRFKMFNYIDRGEFMNIFVKDNKVDMYVIKNNNGLETLVIGKKSVYKIWGKVENCLEIEIILGEIRYPEEVDKILSNILKNEGYNFYCLSNIGLNGKYIRDNKLKRSQRVYYYTYNLNLPKLKTTEFLVNLN